MRHLQNLLRGLEDTRELVVARSPDGDVLSEVWRAAQEEADDAYAAWCEHRGLEPYLLYRAAADRADAAMDAVISAAAAAGAYGR